MARDEGLEELLRDHLGEAPGLTETPMFGGRAWLLHGHLLCGARDDGVLVRLGKGNEQWALNVEGIVPMISRGRVMSGWVRIAAETFGNDDALARKLLAAARAFVRSLPPKSIEVEPAMVKPRRSAGGDAPEGLWTCSACGRSFTRKNQRHACGTGDRSTVLRNRPESVVRLYAAIEAFARSLGPIEIVARERYVLLRSVRIFADLVIMADAVRVAVHLPRKVDDPIFFKIGSDNRQVTHVAKLHTEEELGALERWLREAYAFSVMPRKED